MKDKTNKTHRDTDERLHGVCELLNYSYDINKQKERRQEITEKFHLAKHETDRQRKSLSYPSQGHDLVHQTHIPWSLLYACRQESCNTKEASVC